MVLYVFCVVLCVSFCTRHFVMVPLILTYLHCLQHSLNISWIRIILHVLMLVTVFFQLMGPQFISSIKPNLADMWTPEHEAAWEQLFRLMCYYMRRGMCSI